MQRWQRAKRAVVFAVDLSTRAAHWTDQETMPGRFFKGFWGKGSPDLDPIALHGTDIRLALESHDRRELSLAPVGINR